jgi:hypothetical protein
MMPRAGMCAWLAAIAALGLAAAGCESVKPWERDVLARRDMAWEPDALGSTLDSHIHFAKEASLAGGSAGGGGCGCN